MTNPMQAHRHTLDKIEALRDRYRALSDDELGAKTAEFRGRLAKGESLERVLPEAFATVMEANYRVSGKFPYRNQVMAAIVIHHGNIAAMKTGEGKSLTATLPLYLNALSGKGAILVTVNGYLAARDAEEFRPVFERLGLRLAIGVPPDPAKDFSPAEKRDIYQADVIYSTSDKIGFDYLLENISDSRDEKYLRPFHYCLIDEADAILLDLAQMPLVISGSPRVQSNLYPLAARFVATLREGVEFEWDESKAVAKLTGDGVATANRFFHVDNIYDPALFRLNRHVYLALKARMAFQPYRDYMVVGGKLVLISSVTGRLLEGNKLQGGLHQALEAREGLQITVENRAMASVTYQNLFNMFARLGGMTGTAKGSEKELYKTYGTRVVEIPTHRPVIRQDDPDVVVTTLEEKERLVLDYLETMRATRRPILLTTGSVNSSVKYSGYLLERGIEHNLLNALSHAKEAEMVREAGRAGAITVATLIAGRGTDIKLTPESRELGGLVIIAAEKLPNRRTEGQVRGRSGRQGDPGSSRFFASLQDDLFVRYGSITPENVARRERARRTRSRVLNRAQNASEERATSARKLSKDFEIAMSRQRDLVYQLRDQIIAGGAIARADMDKIADQVFAARASAGDLATREGLARFVFDNLTYRPPSEMTTVDASNPAATASLLRRIFDDRLAAKEQGFADPETFARFGQICLLKSIDQAWVEQVDFLEQLKTVVQDRTVAQHKVEYEYRKEAFFAFEEMKARICADVVRQLSLSSIERGADGALVIQFA
ncbi:MAG: accessory Sec system translocase SecA2 [Promicromonosporaceae bacterium]|nr:accessory Sec system translocase SecA2 [Promicromonosporaceae bacterium]